MKRTRVSIVGVEQNIKTVTLYYLYHKHRSNIKYNYNNYKLSQSKLKFGVIGISRRRGLMVSSLFDPDSIGSFYHSTTRTRIHLSSSTIERNRETAYIFLSDKYSYT